MDWRRQPGHSPLPVGNIHTMSQATELLGASRTPHLRIVGVISAAHFVSHYYILLLAPIINPRISSTRAPSQSTRKPTGVCSTVETTLKAASARPISV